MADLPEIRVLPDKSPFTGVGVHYKKKTNKQTNKQILLKIGKKLITLLSHPQIAYELIEAGELKTYYKTRFIYRWTK